MPLCYISPGGIGNLSLIYLVDHYAMDTDRRELRRGSDLVAVAPQVFDLLHYLVLHRERVVSKDELVHAIWNGRAVSDAALTTRLNVARAAVGDIGKQKRFIQTLPRKGVRFIGQVREAEGSLATRTKRPPAAAGGPSIAVASFANLSSDPEQAYFADGLSEDLTTALSRFRWLAVITSGSRFRHNGRAVDAAEIGFGPGVRYVLQGSVRKTRSRMRITAQLVNAETGANLWADHFDGTLDDVLDLQDRITARVVDAIAPRLERHEFERARRKPAEELSAYDHYLRGASRLRRISQERTDEALASFLRAIELEPGLACAYGLAAWCCVLRKVRGWTKDSAREGLEAVRFARKATLLGGDDATALCTGGYALAFMTREFEDGARFVDRALAIEPNLARGWTLSAWLRVWTGEPDIVLEHIAHAVRLNPLHPHTFSTSGALAYAHFLADHHDIAADCSEKAYRDNPTYMAACVSAASHELAGRPEQARDAMARALGCKPDLCASNLHDFLPFNRAKDAAKLASALRSAGLPGTPK
jgi:TolB-like protein